MTPAIQLLYPLNGGVIIIDTVTTQLYLIGNSQFIKHTCIPSLTQRTTEALGSVGECSTAQNLADI